MYPSSKHIDLPYKFFWYKVESLEIEVISINTNEYLADQFTKGLQEEKFELAHKYLMICYPTKGG